MPLAINVDRLEFAVLAEQSGASRVPAVTAFSHYGAPVADVRREFTAAEERCRHRGLLDRAGHVNGELRDLLAVFARTADEFDLRFSSEREHELRAAVSRSGRDAVRTVIDGETVRVEAVRPDNAIASLVSVMPEQAPARMRPLSIDLAAMDAVMAEHPDGDPDAIEAGLRGHGVDTREYRQITQLLDGPRLGAGQLGVTTWGRERREQRGEQTVQVIDVASGRMAIYNSSGRRMIAGADLGTFNRLLGELAQDARRNAR